MPSTRCNRRRTGHNLLIRLRDYKAKILRFIADFAVLFTNNLAEQDIRMMKVKMKISDGFRTNHGAGIFVTPRASPRAMNLPSW